MDFSASAREVPIGEKDSRVPKVTLEGSLLVKLGIKNLTKIHNSRLEGLSFFLVENSKSNLNLTVCLNCGLDPVYRLTNWNGVNFMPTVALKKRTGHSGL